MRPKNKLELLKEVKEIVSAALTESHGSRFGSVSEKRTNRKLKYIRKALDEWIEEMENVDDKPADTSK